MKMKEFLPEVLSQRLSTAVWKQLSPSRKLPSGLTVEVRSSAEWAVYNDIFVDGEYDSAINVLSSPTSTEMPLIVDLGANVGYFALRFADLWLRRKGDYQNFSLVGVEGSPPTYRELMRRMDQPLLGDQCAFHSGLIGKRDGSGFISDLPFHVANSTGPNSSRFSQEAPFIDLDSLMPNDRRISLLKCDIEGSEEMFLENYPDLMRRVDLAVFELHSEKCDTARCFELLEAAGLVHQGNVRDAGSFRVDVFKRN